MSRRTLPLASMSFPKISLIMNTVRPDAAYEGASDWHVISTVLEDLSKQTFKDFEFLVVDGVREREVGMRLEGLRARRVPPLDNLWTRNRKCAISSYANAGLVHARGELVVRIDDCARLPPMYLEAFWAAYKVHGICLTATWPEAGDDRPMAYGGMDAQRVIAYGRGVPPAGDGGTNLWISKVPLPGDRVYGFGSFPLEAALKLNGYDHMFDGSCYLEDTDFSMRLAKLGIKRHAMYIPGFRQGKSADFDEVKWAQSLHHPDAVDPEDGGICKCCNIAWRLQRIDGDSTVVNTPEDWTKEQVDRLLEAPCPQLREADAKCGHHHFVHDCAYLREKLFKIPGRISSESQPYNREETQSFALAPHPLALQLYEDPPVVDLREERRKAGTDV